MLAHAMTNFCEGDLGSPEISDIPELSGKHVLLRRVRATKKGGEIKNNKNLERVMGRGCTAGDGWRRPRSVDCVHLEPQEPTVLPKSQERVAPACSSSADCYGCDHVRTPCFQVRSAGQDWPGSENFFFSCFFRFCSFAPFCFLGSLFGFAFWKNLGFSSAAW